MEYKVKDFETRYFAGIELIGGYKIGSEDQKKIPGLFEELENLYLDDIPSKKSPESFIGLEIYRFDFMESKMVDYFAMVETNGLVEIDEDNLVTKKLPKGKYIMFPISRERMFDEIKRVYKYVEQEKINVHLGFHVEMYMQHFNDKEMYLCFKLEE
jgi:predicted transcriptional regulator YdeE